MIVALSFAMLSTSSAAPGLDLASSGSGLTLNNFIADHMVLAREPLSANVWGNATAGSKVEISLDGKSVASATATASGRWKAALPPQPAGTDHTITVTDGSASIKIVDVAFGDVRALHAAVLTHVSTHLHVHFCCSVACTRCYR